MLAQKLGGNHDGDHETSSGGSIPHPELAQGVSEWDCEIKWWIVVSLRQKFDRTPDEILEVLGIACQYDAETFSGPESTCTDQIDWVHHIGPVKNLSQINWSFFQREAQKKEAQQEIDRLARSRSPTNGRWTSRRRSSCRTTSRHRRPKRRVSVSDRSMRRT